MKSSESPTTAYFESLGLSLSFHTWGDTHATPLIFLHGFLDQGRSFGPVARRLAAVGYRVIALDHRGHGCSDHIGRGGYYHFFDYVLDLDALYQHLALPEAIIVAHSMGTAIAVYFAGTWPKRVSKLALMDTLGPPERPFGPPERLKRWVEEVRTIERVTPRTLPDREAIRQRLKRASPRASDAVLEELIDSAAIAVDGGYRFRFDPLHRTISPQAFDVNRFEQFLTRIECPTLLLWARESALRFPAVRARAAKIPKATHQELAEVGHNLHHEAPERVAAALLTFLEANTSS